MRTQLFILQISCLPIKIPTCEPKSIWLIKNYIMMLYMLAATRVGLFQGCSQRAELTVLVPECHLNWFKLLSLKWLVFSYVMWLSEFSTCNIVTCMLTFCFSWDALEFVLHLLPSFVVAAMSPIANARATLPWYELSTVRALVGSSRRGERAITDTVCLLYPGFAHKD